MACSRAPEAPKATPAATVSNKVTEESLTTITLTTRAVERLGVQTAELRVAPTAAKREVAAELVVPGGGALLVTAPMAGVVVMSSLVPGVKVKRGQVLLRLAPLPSAAELNAAEARLDIARKRAQRNAELVKEGAVAERSNEDAQLELALAQANLAAAQPGGGTRASIPLFAVRDGVLRDLRVADGQTVAAGAPLFQLDAVSTLWVRAAVPAGLRASTGAATLQTLDRRLTREVSPIEAPPSADPLAATVDRFFSVDNADAALRPGERVLLTLTLEGTEARPLVASSAIVRDIHGGEWLYESLGENRFARRRVSVRYSVGDDVVLSEGAGEAPPVGTKIVTVGTAELFGVEFGAGK
ncbi:MAG: efflux RND transporter periplasmic adaptor subunit [Archangium sp.]|nr:efflux RND transporter periplasmic adaptor subunit [Archangium sp.]